MNKIININLAQRIIPMNESAYNALNDYLDILKRYFGKEEGGDEILRDMEDRIGELLQEKIKKGLVCISDADVEEIKTIMGSPEQIVDEAGSETEQNQKKKNTAEHQQAEQAAQNSGNKHLYRSSSESVIGGVCGGLGAYFNIDPAVIRVLFAIITLFWGSGVIIYCLLWILLPQQDTPTLNLKRRWYRHEDHKIIGGVCGGIGAYLNVDPIWPRLVFLLPVLLGTGIGFFADDFFSFSIGGFPAMVLLYLILWASLPKANTLAEKLEMKGKKVDVKNISEAMKKPQPAVHKASNSGCLNIFIWLLKALLICVGVFVLIILASIAIGLLGALLGIGISSAFILPFSGLILGSGIAKSVLIIALLLIILIPLYLLVHFLVRLISGHKNAMPRWWATTLIILFIAGVFGLFAVAGTVFMDFKTQYSATEDLSLQPFPNDTLVLSTLPEQQTRRSTRNFWDDELKGAVRINFEKSTDSNFHLQLTRQARGQTKAQAITNAQRIQFTFRQNQNRLNLPEELDLSQTLPFRDQHVTLTVFVPVGQWIYIQDAEDDWWGRHYAYRIRRNSIRYESDDDDNGPAEGHYYQMDENGRLIEAGRAGARKDKDTYYY